MNNMPTLMTSQPLKKEFDYFIANQTELVGKYNGKFIVIKDQQVVGVFDSEQEAYSEASGKFELGTFLIQEVKPGSEVYSQTFHSRVII